MMGKDPLELFGLGGTERSDVIVPPVVPKSQAEEPTVKKGRKYRPSAQIFADEDLRLGAAGRLGSSSYA
jgi:hypothetical protein